MAKNKSKKLADELASRISDLGVSKAERLGRIIERFVEEERAVGKARALEPLPSFPEGKNTVVAISDLHAPFNHPDALDFVKALCDRFQPDTMVCLGDELDIHSISRHVRDMDSMGPADELDMGVAELEDWYAEFPQMKVCWSNHTSRPYRKAAEAGLPSRVLKTYRLFMGAPPGWEWRPHWTIDNIRYHHGEGKGGKHVVVNMPEEAKISMVFGHHHSTAGVQLIVRDGGTFWGMGCGCLIDPVRYAFNYGRNALRKSILGTGVVVRGYPVFVPMLTDKRGRWVRNLPI